MDHIERKKRIYHAIRAGDLGEARALIGTNADLRDERVPLYGTWLNMAANLGQLPIVKWLVEAGANVNRQAGASNGNALNEAASEGHLEVARYLLGHGAEMDVSDPVQNPLFSAVIAGSLDIVKLLLAHGIDAKVKYPGEYMPNMDANAFSFAWEQGQREIANYIQHWIREH
jgi:ankyrin repeat protein